MIRKLLRSSLVFHSLRSNIDRNDCASFGHNDVALSDGLRAECIRRATGYNVIMQNKIEQYGLRSFLPASI